ncbi:hypothetical protein [Actinoplanes sp. NPDC020271]|uniref:hypothetical protein n=1 Tax=Actinoplanes sp. NPDC020271 TaxID=3363896 RepID=UPI00379FD212
MTSNAWPAADPRLERRYRWLLLAYSRRYRRRHGTEIVTTLLEMAGPDRARPSAAETWHLISSGIRQRFRLPSGRPLALVAAVLMTVTLGVFGAAAGSWAGQRTLTELPSPEVVRQIGVAALPDAAFGPDYGIADQPGSAGYGHFTALPRAQGPGPAPTWTVEQTRDGLAAAGWKITRFELHPLLAMKSPTDADPLAELSCCQPADPTPFELSISPYNHLRRYAIITAERNGLVVHATATDAIGGDTSKAEVKSYSGGVDGKVFAARSTAYLPLVVAGALLGGLAGWLLTATGAHRVRPMRPARRWTTAVLTGAAPTAAVLPVYAIVRNAMLLAAHLGDGRPVYTLHSVLRPGWWYLENLPAPSVPACAVAAGVAALLALASTWGRTPELAQNAAQPS